jgi:Protein of unknown function (DUF2934)
MAQKKTPTKALDETAKAKSTNAGKKQAPSRARTRKTPAPPDTEAEAYALTDDQIAQRAYALWEARGRPMNSQDEDWYRAKEELQAGR